MTSIPGVGGELAHLLDLVTAISPFVSCRSRILIELSAANSMLTAFQFELNLLASLFKILLLVFNFVSMVFGWGCDAALDEKFNIAIQEMCKVIL